MINYDIVSYTSIFIDRCINFISDLLQNDNVLSGGYPLSISLIMKSLRLCLNSTLLTFNGTLYKQTSRLAMGSSMYPIVANLFIFADNIKARIWLRFVDDTFVVIKKIHLRSFSKLISALSSHIKFTYENENEHDKLPFLDYLVKRNLSGALNLTIYRKPTHSNNYIDFSEILSGPKSF